MHDTIRTEELRVWRTRIRNGLFEPADLCAFTQRLMDALELQGGLTECPQDTNCHKGD